MGIGKFVETLTKERQNPFIDGLLDGPIAEVYAIMGRGEEGALRIMLSPYY